jgi:hypothetical protein
MEGKNRKSKAKEFIKALGWVIALLLLFFLLGIIMGPHLVSSLSWPMDKTTTCAFFNYTGTPCEQFWCNSILECNYSITKSACICSEMINNTIIVYTNISANSTNETYFNFSNVTQDYIIFLCQNFTKDQIRQLRDSLLDRLENYTYPSYNSDGYDSKPASPWFWLVVVIVIMAGLSFMSWNYTKASKEKAKVGQLRRDFSNAHNFQNSETTEKISKERPTSK